MTLSRSVSICILLIIMILPICFSITETTLEHDACGNLISGDGYYRVYNSFNQLWKIYEGSDENGTLLEEYSWHPLEERVHVKKEYYSNGSIKEKTIYVNKNSVFVINDSGQFKYTYIYHNGELVAQEVNGERTFIHGDLVGSTTAVTNESGDVIENISYEPYGQRLTDSELRYGYEGKEHTSTGHIDFGSRMYDPDIGLFTQPDTLIPNVYDPQLLNRYMFMRGNPYKYVDIDGHEPIQKHSGNVEQVSRYIRQIEAQLTSEEKPASPSDVLNTLSQNYDKYNDAMAGKTGSSSFVPRYVFTKSGVVDMKHFFKNARWRSSGVPSKILSLIGYGIEIYQSFRQKYSAFSYEDLYSNRLGSEFGSMIDDQSFISDQFEGFMIAQGAAPWPNDFYNVLPNEESGAPLPKHKKSYRSRYGFPSRDAVRKASNDAWVKIINKLYGGIE